MKTYFKIIFSILLFSLLIPLFTKAITFGPPFEGLTFEKLTENIVNFIFWVAMAIVPIMIIVAAFYFLTSGGNPEKVNIAKKIILFTFIGLFIVLLGKGIPSIIRQILEGPSCQPYSFIGGTVSPDTVNPTEVINTTCDYGAPDIDCIDSFVGPNQCPWTGWDGTKATFSCQSPPSYGVYTHVCQLRSGTASKCCVQSNKNGSVQVQWWPSCAIVFNRIQAAFNAPCGDARYDPVADVNKNKIIDIYDAVLLTSCLSEACCQSILSNTTDPCGS